MKSRHSILTYLKDNNLILTTAESCTAGRIIHLLSEHSGAGECLDAGFVVYSEAAKKKVLQVRQKTIEKYSLTSEEVAKEMVEGAFHCSSANVIVATTGIAGSEPMDGVMPGTVCFGFGFKVGQKIHIDTETKHFRGKREAVQDNAAEYALSQIPFYHQNLGKK